MPRQRDRLGAHEQRVGELWSVTSGASCDQRLPGDRQRITEDAFSHQRRRRTQSRITGRGAVVVVASGHERRIVVEDPAFEADDGVSQVQAEFVAKSSAGCIDHLESGRLTPGPVQRECKQLAAPFALWCSGERGRQFADDRVIDPSFHDEFEAEVDRVFPHLVQPDRLVLDPR